MDVLERMKNLGLSQVDILFELRKRGIVVQPPELSQMLRGVYTYPKTRRVLSECDKILVDIESDRFTGQ